MRTKLIMLFLCVLTAVTAHSSNPVTPDCKCKDKDIPLYGRVKIVDSFPDFEVKIVGGLPDLKVQKVESFPDKCGKWQFVESFPDFTVRFVEGLPDFTIQYVESFPGVNKSLY